MISYCSETSAATSARKPQVKDKEIQPPIQTPLANQETPQNTHACFLHLPRELRDQIYHEIWKTKTPFQVALPRGATLHIFQVQYDTNTNTTTNTTLVLNQATQTPTTTRQPASSWILSNRQILQEAMSQFHRKSTWTYLTRTFRPSHPHHLATWTLPPAPASALSSPSPTHLLTPSLTPIISLSPALNMGIFTSPSLTPATQTQTQTLEFYGPATDLLNPLLNATSPTNKLKSLSLTIQANAWHLDNDDNTTTTTPTPIVVDFAPLSRVVSTLHVLRVQVRFSPIFATSKRRVERLREGILELGGRVGGGNGIGDGIEVGKGSGMGMGRGTRWWWGERVVEGGMRRGDGGCVLPVWWEFEFRRA